jgi:hypothetical protein
MANNGPIITNRNSSNISGLKIPKLSDEIDTSPRLFMIKKKSCIVDNHPNQQPRKSIDHSANTNSSIQIKAKRSSFKENRSSLPENKLNPATNANNGSASNGTSLNISNSFRQKSNNNKFGYMNNKPSSETSLLNVVSSGVQSHENSFLQLNQKLNNRGMQTEYVELSSSNSITTPNSSIKLNSLNTSRIDSSNLLKESKNNV